MLDVLVRVFVSSTTLLWIDDLGWTSLASRGRIRNSKMKIEILVAFFLSRGRIRNSKKMQLDNPTSTSGHFKGENSNPTSGHLKAENFNPTSGHLQVEIFVFL